MVSLLTAKAILVRRKDIYIFNQLGQTPLSVASENGNAAIVKDLLDSGADLSISDIYRISSTPCIFCIPYASGFTPLHYASGAGKLLVVQALIEASADLNSRDADGISSILSNSLRGA